VSDRFAGKVALVTGAARPRSIGRATALRLALDGADVACLDIARPYADAPEHATATADDLDSIVAEIEALGRRAVAVRADVSDDTEVEAAVATATEALGTIQLVANVAGGSGMGFGVGPLLNLGVDEFRRVLDVNVVGTWLVSKACAQRMVDAKVGGRICNVSSQAGKKAFPMLGPYCAAKSGVILLTQCLAAELGPAGISVNAVCPGTVDTDLINPNGMFEMMLGGPEGVKAFIDREIPLGRLQSAEEIAANTSAGQTMV
jgi:NAD(P)-dependent dehydrogenase (short-subunit alcohol dehydrogenase family)